MTTNNNKKSSVGGRAVLSVHTKHDTREKLGVLARATNRTKSALANEALDQYLAHQEWIVREIEAGIRAAKKGELVEDDIVEDWFSSIGAKK